MIWFQGWDSIPEKLLPNVQSVIDKNPDWKLIKWDENGIRATVKSLGDDYLNKYDSFKLLHQKIDFGRYAILYVYGGVSVDTDIFAFKGFDETPDLDTSNFIVSYNSTAKAINNATILTSQNNPILRGLLDEIPSNCTPSQPKFSCIQQTTGPIHFTEYLNKFRDQITVLDNSYFEPCSGLDPYCEIKSNSILDHRHELSWFTPFQKKVASMPHFIRHHKFILSIALILIIILLIKKIIY